MYLDLKINFFIEARENYSDKITNDSTNEDQLEALEMLFKTLNKQMFPSKIHAPQSKLFAHGDKNFAQKQDVCSNY